MLSAIVVTASGDIVVANETSNADLFWALRGGGGGTFGIIISITYRTHPAPIVGGFVKGTVACQDEETFEQLLVAFLTFLPRLFTQHWGDTVTPDGLHWRIQVDLRYIGISQAEARAVWEPFLEAVNESMCS